MITLPDNPPLQQELAKNEMLMSVHNPRGTGCGTCLGVIVGVIVFIVTFYLLGIYRGS
jgi:hypothetical protein